MTELGSEPSPASCQSPRTSHQQEPLKAEAAPLSRSPGPPCPLSGTGTSYPSPSCYKLTPQPHRGPPGKEEGCWDNWRRGTRSLMGPGLCLRASPHPPDLGPPWQWASRPGRMERKHPSPQPTPTGLFPLPQKPACWAVSQSWGGTGAGRHQERGQEKG